MGICSSDKKYKNKSNSNLENQKYATKEDNGTKSSDKKNENQPFCTEINKTEQSTHKVIEINALIPKKEHSFCPLSQNCITTGN